MWSAHFHRFVGVYPDHFSVCRSQAQQSLLGGTLWIHEGVTKSLSQDAMVKTHGETWRPTLQESEEEYRGTTMERKVIQPLICGSTLNQMLTHADNPITEQERKIGYCRLCLPGMVSPHQIVSQPLTTRWKMIQMKSTTTLTSPKHLTRSCSPSLVDLIQHALRKKIRNSFAFSSPLNRPSTKMLPDNLSKVGEHPLPMQHLRQLSRKKIETDEATI